MVTTLKEKNNKFYCANCMMQQPQLRSTCWWCGNTFSNYLDKEFELFRQKEHTYEENNRIRSRK